MRRVVLAALIVLGAAGAALYAVTRPAHDHAPAPLAAALPGRPWAASPARHGLLAGSGERWFRWVATTSGRATVAQAVAGAAPTVNVYRGPSPARLRPLPSTHATSGRGVAASFHAQAGHAYYLEVAPQPHAVKPYRLLIVPSTRRVLLAPRRARTATDEGPAVSCAPAPAGWRRGPVEVACTATSTVGLMSSADAGFTLAAAVPDGTDAPNASTGTQTVCDKDGTCAVAGPVTGIELDRRPPTTVCDPVPDQWSALDVSIHCVAVDTGSGLADPSQASTTESTSVPAGEARAVTLSAVKVCDAVGNCATAGPFGPIRVDKSAPIASCARPAAGWAAHQARVVCHVTDAGSGLADPSQASVTLSTGVASDSYDRHASTGTAKVCSVVRTCVTVGPFRNLHVDLAPPTVSCTLPVGWSVSPATVRCTAVDDGSGLARGSDRSFTLRATVPSGTRTDNASTSSRRVCDAVGNCAAAGPIAGVRIDEQAPTVSCSRPSTRWSRATVVVRCSASDAASGLRDAGDASFTLRAAAPPDGVTTNAATGSRRVCSKLGVCTTAGPFAGIRIDTTKPHVACASAPSHRVTMNVRLACTAKAAGSGLADPSASAFELATHVPAGSVDTHAPTDARRVCNAAGGCVTVGPFTVDVDRKAPAAGGPPRIAVPKRATVVLAAPVVHGAGATSYVLPAAHDSLGQRLSVVCNPGPGASLSPGWRVVACSSTDGADRQTVASFPVAVKVVPALGSIGTAASGGSWRAVGVGYAPRSPVSIAFDGVHVGTGVANAHGVVSAAFTVPSGRRGLHAVSVLGKDRAGDPLTSVADVRTAATASGAPPRPPVAAVLPPDPGHAPAVRTAAHFKLAAPAIRHAGANGRLSLWWWLAAGLVALGLGAAVAATRFRRP